MPGCIIHAVSQSQTKNPVILLDEIDKMVTKQLNINQLLTLNALIVLILVTSI